MCTLMRLMLGLGRVESKVREKQHTLACDALDFFFFYFSTLFEYYMLACVPSSYGFGHKRLT